MISKLFKESSDEVQFYLRTQVDYLKLLGTEKLVKMCSLILSSMILTIIFSSLLMFLSLAASIYIGHLMDGIHLGFLVVAAFYAILGVMLYTFRKYIISEPILRKVVRTLFEEDQPIRTNHNQNNHTTHDHQHKHHHNTESNHNTLTHEAQSIPSN